MKYDKRQTDGFEPASRPEVGAIISRILAKGFTVHYPKYLPHVRV